MALAQLPVRSADRWALLADRYRHRSRPHLERPTSFSCFASCRRLSAWQSAIRS